MEKQKTNVINLFNKAKEEKTYLKISAPMVRYSRVQFRSLVKKYNVDLAFTPMILANAFCQNSKARFNEFLTTTQDTPLIVQFAANNENDFLDASKLVYPYADGVDLNCGCPQRWAMKDGYGCALLSKPEIIHGLVRAVKSNIPHNFTVSVKVRLLRDIRTTIVMCQQLEKCGVDFLTLHGRTPDQKSSEAINEEAMSDVFGALKIPCIANGGIRTLQDADELYTKLNCDGVMAASGLLSNPALFSGATTTPVECIKTWMELKNLSKDKITFQCYHHHLVFMLEKTLSKKQKQIFNYLQTFEDVDNFLFKHIISDSYSNQENIGDFITCYYDEKITFKHNKKCRSCGFSVHYCVCIKYDQQASDGTFFTTYVKTSDDLDYMDSNIFEEKVL
ncbi:tRNA-dihydrouridine(20a/20b) synthase [NAD(P)+]-like isoform X1 [Pieris rapae]|uniref:tRNA-dihydrouridine(20a/20b) synthase [NAD(P)+]-like isoform X1 n=1 Tax=Pieris rapae TaxID=64459 RepID=UPI001E281529|nr:tRNA-dihydrouridine(20a/20b) synthase [NAD(P)+]-like isoform X1 [Pieris rapae]